MSTEAVVETPILETAEPAKRSSHKVEVVQVVLEKHPNADRLSVARVFGFTCVTATEQWAGKTLAAYLPPDSVVDVTRPEFEFLAKQAKADGTARIKAMKLRGVLSFGLLVPAPEGAAEGDDVAELLGVTHYEPPIPGSGSQKGGLITGGEAAAAPHVYAVKYDLEAGRRYAQKVFTPGEPVMITEKIHGANARYVFHNGQMYCGSRTEWKKEYPSYDHITVESLEPKVGREKAESILERLRTGTKAKNLWWKALEGTPTLKHFCETHPGIIVYGEVYGQVQDLTYGCEKGEVRFAAFDVMQDGYFLNAQEARDLLTSFDVPMVPPFFLDPMPFDFDKICDMAEGASLIPGANHVREGVVVVPLRERQDDTIGRVKLKWVSAGYLEHSKG